jgi:ABC-2 type transport system permease protein
MSPIHDQSYRRYQGTRQPVGRGWTVIAGEGIRQMLAKRVFLGLLIFAYIPLVVRLVQLYFAVNFPQASSLLAVDAAMFRDFLDQQGVFVFFTTIYVGAGLIASDRRANALQIYLSKPLLRMEYIAGKLMILVTFLLMITLVPSLLLLMAQMAMSASLDFFKANLFLLPAIVLGSLVHVAVASFTMLALSSLSKSSRYVALLYTGTIFFTEAVYGVMRGVLNTTRVGWVSVSANLEQVTNAIYRQPLGYDSPLIVSVLVLLGLVVVSVSVLERRVRGVEVVS